MKTKLIVEKTNLIVTLALNRPEVHNAIDDELIALMISALETIQKDDEIRVVILKANGKSFSAGADVNWMQKMLHYTKEENLNDSRQLATLMNKLYHLNKPTIALVQGAAFGGALGLIACCDIAIAADIATFCLSEVKLGLIPAVISPYVIQAIGVKGFSRYAITAEVFNAATAKELGLINEVISTEELTHKAEEIITAILKNSPKAIAAVKNLLHTVQQKPLDQTMIQYTAEQIAAIRISNEGQEGLMAFLEKRKPKWNT